MHLRGFDRRGAAAALHSATSNSLRCSGVFRSADDFAVVVVFKRDNIFEHHSVRWLEDGNLAGMVWDFNYNAGDSLAPLDSTFFESIPNRSLSFIRNNGTSGTTPLFDHAALAKRVHINAVGAFSPEMVEIPSQTVTESYVVVDDYNAASREAGDLLQAGRLPDADLTELLEGTVPEHAGRTLFKSVGIASQDIAAARAALVNAERHNLGVSL